ncbi:MAG: flagellar hook-basal body complex protein FliE [Lachnospiraceae bacterium]|nr:flagellar hook-basal body complex protein FliE [Lachnospiraceae bacterium]
MELSNIRSTGSESIARAAAGASTAKPVTDEGFSSFLDSAISNIRETNALLHDSDEEKIKFAMGISENTHDLAIAAAKASTALSYTVALRDRFIEAYRELMQIQV